MIDDTPTIFERVLDPARYPPAPGEYWLVLGVCAPVAIALLILVWRIVRRPEGMESGLERPHAVFGVPLAFLALLGAPLLMLGASAVEQPLLGGAVKVAVTVACIALLALLPWQQNPPKAQWMRCEWKWLWRTPLVWLLSLPMMLATVLASAALVGLAGLPITEQEAVVQVRQTSGAGQIIGWYMLAGLAAPLAEEFAFRLVLFGGMMYALLSFRVPRVAAAWIAGAVSVGVFVVAHDVVSWPMGILPLTVLATVLTWLYAYSRSLWPPVILHLLHNSLVLTLQFFVVAP